MVASNTARAAHITRNVAIRAISQCKPYMSPAAGATVNSSAPFVIEWNTACFTDGPSTIDIVLYAPYNPTPKIFQWTQVAFAPGRFETQLMPRWWNATDSVQLQLGILESGSPFPSNFGPSPMFTATYTAPTDGKVAPAADPNVHDSGFAVVRNWVKHLSGGAIAAAVIVPLLFIGALAAFFVIRRARKQVADKRKSFAAAVDRRMSTVSAGWQSTTAAGAQAAIRNSMATYGRPSGEASTVGTGLRPAARTGLGGTTRVSRVSFATDSMYGRPSMSESRTSMRARSFIATDAPPVPAMKGQDDVALVMSPTQALGARALSAADIHPYARGEEDDEDVMPALSLMRETNNDEQPSGSNSHYLAATPADSYLAPSTPSSAYAAYSPMPSSAGFPVPPTTTGMPLPPVPATLRPVSPASPTSPLGMMPLSPLAAFTPDAALREYAARSKMAAAGGGAGNAPAFPARTLYAPESNSNSVYRKSEASEYSAE